MEIDLEIHKEIEQIELKTHTAHWWICLPTISSENKKLFWNISGPKLFFPHHPQISFIAKTSLKVQPCIFLSFFRHISNQCLHWSWNEACKEQHSLHGKPKVSVWNQIVCRNLQIVTHWWTDGKENWQKVKMSPSRKSLSLVFTHSWRSETF